MRKILLILITTLLVLSLTGCEAKPKAAPLAETAYIEAFDEVIDIRTAEKSISAESMMGETTLSEKVDYLMMRNRNFVIVRAECTGNWVQKSYDSEEHYNYHGKSRLNRYIEIPFSIKEVLEGNDDIVKDVKNLQLEITGLTLFKPEEFYANINEKNKDKPIISYSGATHHFVYPRIGCEYVLILEYHKETDCIALNTGGGIICELSKPKDYYKYWCTIHNQPIREEIDYDYGIPPMYYEALERYNIKVK